MAFVLQPIDYLGGFQFSSVFRSDRSWWFPGDYYTGKYKRMKGCIRSVCMRHPYQISNSWLTWSTGLTSLIFYCFHSHLYITFIDIWLSCKCIILHLEWYRLFYVLPNSKDAVLTFFSATALTHIRQSLQNAACAGDKSATIMKKTASGFILGMCSANNRRQCNVFSHWLSQCPEWSLCMCPRRHSPSSFLIAICVQYSWCRCCNVWCISVIW